jgi:hypothetical protein
MMSASKPASHASAHSPYWFAAAQPKLFQAEVPRARLSDAVEDCEQTESRQERTEWTDEEIVMLHGILFDTCEEKLKDPETPLDEVIDCLRWIFSDTRKDDFAFSFSNTLKLYRRPNARDIREEMQSGVKRYLAERLKRYPSWVAEAFWSDPERFADELERNPQWINESLRRQARDGDLFAV